MDLLSSLSCSSKLTRPKVELVEPLIYSQLITSIGSNLGSPLATELEGSLVGLNLHLWKLMIYLGKYCQHWVELNCMIPTWCSDHCLGVSRETPFHTLELGIRI